MFDKVRLDAQAPSSFGAKITYDIPLNGADRKPRETVTERTQRTETFVRAEAGSAANVVVTGSV